MQINLSRLHFPVTTLGPGRRVGIWLQGCSIRCPGCISADTWGFSRGRTTIDQVMAAIEPWLPVADGITISGGEPFDQPQALLALLQGLSRHPVQNVLIYSGYPVEALTESLRSMEGLIDALISDPFSAAAGQTKVLRGSDNQRMLFLTDKGASAFAPFERPLNASDRSLDVMFDDDGTVWLAGIPRLGDMRQLQTLLAAQGHQIKTTQDPRGER